MKLRVPRQLPHRLRRGATAPLTQVLFAFGGVIGGAALISRVALGVALVLASMLVLVDGLWRDDANGDRRRTLRSVQDTHDDVIQNYRRAP